MKLLFDHHLSRKLVTRLADVFPGSSHVVFHGLDTADDIIIWAFARTNDYTIVAKDSDFNIEALPPNRRVQLIAFGTRDRWVFEVVLCRAPRQLMRRAFGPPVLSTVRGLAVLSEVWCRLQAVKWKSPEGGTT